MVRNSLLLGYVSFRIECIGKDRKRSEICDSEPDYTDKY